MSHGEHGGRGDENVEDSLPADLPRFAGRLSDEALAPVNRLSILGRVLSGVFHQVNNHLQVISGAVEMLHDQPLSEGIARRVNRIQDHSSRAAAIVSELLQFARASGTDRTPVDLRSLRERAVALMQYPLAKAGITVTLDGVFDKAPTVSGSAVEIQQAILNLLLNAQHALRGRPAAEIRVALRVDGDRVEIEVADNGPGVPADLRSRIFEPFFTTHPGDGAAGLGLAVVSAIAAGHDAHLLLRDRPGGGAVFVLAFPTHRPAARL